jgi:hypothetical protein
VKGGTNTPLDPGAQRIDLEVELLLTVRCWWCVSHRCDAMLPVCDHTLAACWCQLGQVTQHTLHQLQFVVRMVLAHALLPLVTQA